MSSDFSPPDVQHSTRHMKRKRESQIRENWIEATIFVLISATVLAFVVNVSDGTFLKAPLLYLSCAVIAGIAAYRALDRGEVALKWNIFHVVFLIYLLASAISLANALNMQLSGKALAGLLCLFALFSAANSSLPVAKTTSVLLAAVSAACGVALLHFVLPESSGLADIARQLSTISTLGNSTYFSGFLVMMAPIVIAKLVIPGNRIPERGLLAMLLAAIGYLLVVTESRSAWVAGLLSTMIFLWLNFTERSARRKSFLLTAVVVVILGLLFRETILHRLSATFDVSPHSSFIRRLFFYDAAWKAFLHSTAIGNGLGNFIVFLPRFRSPDYWMFRSEDIVPHAHNEFLEVLSETGLVGFVPFCLLLILFFKKSYTAIGTMSGADRTLMVGFFCSVIAALADNLASMNLRTIPVACCFWIIIGLALQRCVVAEKSVVLRLPPSVRRWRYVPAAILFVGSFLYLPTVYDRYLIERDYLAGFLLRYQKQYDQAAAAFRHVLSLDGRHPEAHLYLATILMDRSQYREARGHLESILIDYPYYPKARMLLAVSDLETGDTLNAVTNIAAELTVDKSPQPLYFATTIHRRLNHRDMEIGLLSELLRQSAAGENTEFAARAVERLDELEISLIQETSIVPLLRELQRKFVDDDALQAAIRAIFQRRGAGAPSATPAAGGSANSQKNVEQP